MTDPMIEATAIARRLDAAIAKAKGKAAGECRTYAQAVTRSQGGVRILAYYEAGTHEETFTINNALAACDYFENGGTIRMSVQSHLGI